MQKNFILEKVPPKEKKYQKCKNKDFFLKILLMRAKFYPKKELV